MSEPRRPRVDPAPVERLIAHAGEEAELLGPYGLLVCKVRHEGTVRDTVAHIAVAVDVDVEGRKHVLGCWVETAGGAKFCLPGHHRVPLLLLQGPQSRRRRPRAHLRADTREIASSATRPRSAP
jgi:hypothetical protein